MIRSYNLGMGGVDRMDQNVGGYQTSMPSKIWKLSFFVFVADCFLQNAWITYGMASSNINILLDWLAFKKQVALVYAKNFTTDWSVGRISVTGAMV